MNTTENMNMAPTETFKNIPHGLAIYTKIANSLTSASWFYSTLLQVSW